MTKSRKRKLGPSKWNWREPQQPNIPDTAYRPVRRLQEFTPTEQAALLVKLRMWLDPDVGARRRQEWTKDSGAVYE